MPPKRSRPSTNIGNAERKITSAKTQQHTGGDAKRKQVPLSMNDIRGIANFLGQEDDIAKLALTLASARLSQNTISSTTAQSRTQAVFNAVKKPLDSHIRSCYNDLLILHDYVKHPSKYVIVIPDFFPPGDRAYTDDAKSFNRTPYNVEDIKQAIQAVHQKPIIGRPNNVLEYKYVWIYVGGEYAVHNYNLTSGYTAEKCVQRRTEGRDVMLSLREAAFQLAQHWPHNVCINLSSDFSVGGYFAPRSRRAIPKNFYLRLATNPTTSISSVFDKGFVDLMAIGFGTEMFAAFTEGEIAPRYHKKTHVTNEEEEQDEEDM